MDTVLRFQVLGPVVAYGARGPVALGPARQRTVLAALLIEPDTTVSFERLIDRVWGGQPPRRARQTMHSYLSRLRTLLGEVGGPVLVRRSHSYLLEVEPEAVDLFRFRATVRKASEATDDGRAAALWHDALALWRGTPFADLVGDWARSAAATLEAERLAATLDRNDVLLRCDDHARLLPMLAADTAVYPLDERLAGQLMLALYRSGRQADALAHYRSLVARLADQVGSDPGPALQRLHHQVLRQDPQLTATVVTAPSASPTTSVATGGPGGMNAPDGPPAQLPADFPGFSGRAGPLRQLDRLLGPAGEPSPTAVVAAIGGSAGIGKTALAVHWAHQVRDRFPHGQLYLNLRGFDPTGRAMTIAEAARVLLELLAIPPKRIPTSVEAQIGLYRSRLAGTETLVVLDNARDAEQVRPLIPGSPGCMALVTSRSQLAGLAATKGAHLIQLDVLDDDEARHLLARRLGAERMTAEPDAVHAIVAACGGLPLALAVVAARAATSPTFPLAAFAEELADARGRLDALAGPDAATDMRAVFSWSYDALSPPAAHLFRLLGLHPGPDIGLHAVASLADLPVPRARRRLAELTRAHLVNEHAPGRYACHDLLSAYSAELADTIDTALGRHAAQHRMLDYYLHATTAADKWLPTDREPTLLSAAQPGVVPERFDDNAAARTWLATELRVLLTIVDRTTGGFDAHLQQLVSVINTFLIWSGLWHDKITAQLASLRAARQCADRPAQARIHRGLAHAYERTKRPEKARSHVHEALALYRDIGDHTGQARTLVIMVWLAERDGRFADGLQYARQSLDAARLSGDRVLQALARNAIGWCHTLLGEHEQAISHCQQALAELRELGQPVSMVEVDTWGTLGRAHHHLGQYRQALDCRQQAVDWAREHGNRQQEASALAAIGDTHHAAADRDAAREAWQQALDIYHELHHPDADRLRERLTG